jgi:hypothetical protein
MYVWLAELSHLQEPAVILLPATCKQVSSLLAAHCCMAWHGMPEGICRAWDRSRGELFVPAVAQFLGEQVCVHGLNYTSVECTLKFSSQRMSQ